jgi:Superinfection immunity protein
MEGAVLCHGVAILALERARIPSHSAGQLVRLFSTSIVAFVRKHVQAAPVVVLNMFLGWMLIGWVGCLAWAVSPNTHKRTE